MKGSWSRREQERGWLGKQRMLKWMFLLRVEEKHNPAFHAGKYFAKPFPRRREREGGKATDLLLCWLNFQVPLEHWVAD